MRTSKRAKAAIHETHLRWAIPIRRKDGSTFLAAGGSTGWGTALYLKKEHDVEGEGDVPNWAMRASLYIEENMK